MRQINAPGLKTRIVLALAAISFVFIVITEFSVSSLVRVAMVRQAEMAPQGESHEASMAFERDVARLRKLVFFYLVIGAVSCLILGSVAIAKLVVRPLHQLNLALDRVSAGHLDTQVPISGAKEIVTLGVAFNHMTATLRKQQLELQQKILEIESSAASLKEAQDSLIRAARLASVGTLAAGVAHEIGNPLAGILGLLEALETDIDDETATRYRTLMKKEISRIDKIIGDLLTYARPASTRESGIPHFADLEEVFAQLRDLLSAQRLFDKVEIRTQLEDGPFMLAISKDELTQLLLNLFLNAANAMGGRGRIDVQVERVTRSSFANASSRRESVQITIADTGPGVPEEHAEKIFDPFFSGHQKSSGLGLAICQSICHRADGDIKLVKDHEPGAMFVISLHNANCHATPSEIH